MDSAVRFGFVGEEDEFEEAAPSVAGV